MRTPSIKMLRERLNLSLPDAKKIKQSMENESNPTKTLNLANYFMKGCGVESLYPEFKDFYYVNMGETYATTLCYDGSSFFIGSYGDYVEKHDSELE